MSRQEEINFFLKSCSDIYKNNEELPITNDSIYFGLMNYDYTSDELANRDASTTVNDVINHFSNSKELSVYVDERQKRFVQFRSKKRFDNPYLIKLYLSIPKEYFTEVSNLVFDYIEKRGIITYSKISDIVRSDDIVIRLINKEDANEIMNFINNNEYINRVSRKTNPFVHREGIVGISYDEYFSYNTVVSELIAKYLNELKNNNELDKANAVGFYSFLTKYYSDLFVNYSKIESVRDFGDFSYSEKILASTGAAINNLEKVIRLIGASVSNSITTDTFYSYYDNCKNPITNYKCTKMYDDIYNKGNQVQEEKNVTLNLSSILNGYIDHAYIKYGSVYNVINQLYGYANGIKNAITNDNNYRDLFVQYLSSSTLLAMTNNDISSYVYERCSIYDDKKTARM